MSEKAMQSTTESKDNERMDEKGKKETMIVKEVVERNFESKRVFFRDI